MRLLRLSLGLLAASCTPTPEPVPVVPEPPPPLETAVASASPLDVAKAPMPTASATVVATPPTAPVPPPPTLPPAVSATPTLPVALAIPPLPTFNPAIKGKPTKSLPPAPDDPVAGRFSLADATSGLPGKGTLVADIETTLGTLTCRLLTSQAPRNVANFVGLARGLRPFRDPLTNTWVQRPAYDGTVFHRIIPGFMIQGGDPSGTGRGEPGYLVPDEVWPGGAHDRPGLLCAANRGPDTNGMQFFLTDGPAAHIDNGFTIFGVCAPLELIHQIATLPKDRTDRPRSPVIMNTVKIRRAPGP